MKKILIFSSLFLAFGCYAQDTITVQTVNSGSFQTITYGNAVYDTVYSESSYPSSGGGTISLLVNTFAQRESQQPKAEVEPVSFAVYPNPGKGLCEIVSSYAITHLDVYSVVGEALFSKRVKEPYRILVDITSLPIGVYFFKVRFSDGSDQVKRVILQ
jgi:hypothetical protein